MPKSSRPDRFENLCEQYEFYESIKSPDGLVRIFGTVTGERLRKPVNRVYEDNDTLAAMECITELGAAVPGKTPAVWQLIRPPTREAYWEFAERAFPGPNSPMRRPSMSAKNEQRFLRINARIQNLEDELLKLRRLVVSLDNARRSASLPEVQGTGTGSGESSSS